MEHARRGPTSTLRRRTHIGAATLLLTLLATSCELDALLSGSSGNNDPEPTRVSFAVQPIDSKPLEPIGPPPQVRITDTAGVTDASFNGNVTIALQSGNAGAALTGTKTRQAHNGVVTFPDLCIDTPGADYRLVATVAGAPTVTSAPFDVIAPDAGPGPPTTLASVSGNGQTGTVGQPLSASYVVRVTDADDKPISGITVSWTVITGGGSVTPQSGATNASGQASATQTLGNATGAQSVRASVSGLTPITFTSTANAALSSSLSFSVQPSDAAVGVVIAPAVVVTARDALGNVAAAYTGTVTLALSGGAANATLGGTTARAAVAGVATFTGLSVSAAGANYRLTATASGLASATSATFDISAPSGGVPTTLAAQSGNAQSGTVGEALGNPYVVRVTDANNAAVAGVVVSWAVTAGGGSVSPQSSTTNSSGQASAMHTLGTGIGEHAVRASVSGLTAVTFTATAHAAAATQLSFTVQPSNADVGEAIAPAVEVTARDSYGNRATSFSGTVTLALTGGTAGVTLGGTKARAASSGVIAFPGLTVSAAGNAYHLAASANGLAAATSAAFNVSSSSTGVPTTVTLVSGNGQSGTVGAALGDAYVVRVTDASGAPVQGVSVSWAVTSGGGSVSPQSTTTNSEGRTSATHTLGTGAGSHAVRATVSGLTPVMFTSTAVADVPAELAFTTQPSDAGMGQTISPAVRVTVRDRYGNIATNYSGSITMSIAPLTGTPLATLNGTVTRPVTGGVATFNDLSINLVGVGYRLRASGAGLTAESVAFTILL